MHSKRQGQSEEIPAKNLALIIWLRQGFLTIYIKRHSYCNKDVSDKILDMKS